MVTKRLAPDFDSPPATCSGVLHATGNRFSHPLEFLFFRMHHENLHHLRSEIPFCNLRRAHWKMLENAECCQVNPQFGGTILLRWASVVLISVLAYGRLQLTAASAMAAIAALLTACYGDDMPDGDWRTA